MKDVRIVYRKYGGALHWNHPGHLLGEDEHGVWVWVPGGTSARKGDDPPVRLKTPITMLFPRDAWWTASFHVPPHRSDLYIDVTTVPEWRDDEVTMLDLDLDVIRLRDGRIILDDEDEFAEHQLLLNYPTDLITQAEKSAHWLINAVSTEQGPFGGAHLAWQPEATERDQPKRSERKPTMPSEPQSQNHA